MDIKTKKPAPRGRPQADHADSHDEILTAVYELLHEMTVRELTMEKIAKRAGVGKPTLYRWWGTKASLVVAMFNERIVPDLDASEAASLEASITEKIERLIAAFNGFFGKVISELIAEGQNDPEVLEELKENYTKLRRSGTVNDIIEAQKMGLVPDHVNPEVVVDAIFGSLYFNLLLKVRPLTPEYGRELVKTCKRLLEI